MLAKYIRISLFHGLWAGNKSRKRNGFLFNSKNVQGHLIVAQCDLQNNALNIKVTKYMKSKKTEMNC